MEWTIRLEAEGSRGERESVALMTITRPAVATAAEEVGLGLAEAKALLSRPQTNMARMQLAEHGAQGRTCPGCRAAPRVKDCRPRRLQTLSGTVEVEAPRSRACPCGQGRAKRARRHLRSATSCEEPAARRSWGGYRLNSGPAPRSERPPGSSRRCCRSRPPTTPAFAIGPTLSGDGPRPASRRAADRTGLVRRGSWSRWTAPMCGPPPDIRPAASR
jgi:hypothetical protein